MKKLLGNIIKQKNMVCLGINEKMVVNTSKEIFSL